MGKATAGLGKGKVRERWRSRRQKRSGGRDADNGLGMCKHKHPCCFTDGLTERDAKLKHKDNQNIDTCTFQRSNLLQGRIFSSRCDSVYFHPYGFKCVHVFGYVC